MGHLGRIKDEYRTLLHRLEAGPLTMAEPRDPDAWRAWSDLLEILFTPEDAALASKMPVRPCGLRAIAARTGLSEAELKPRLDTMCERGIVLDLVHPRTGATTYLLAPPIVGFIEFSMMRAHEDVPKKRLVAALEAYTHGDEAFAREVFGGETVVGRAMVHENAIAEGDLPEVLDWERATAAVEAARAHAVSSCFCRHEAEHMGRACSAPQEVCLSLNGGAEFVARRGFGRAIDRRQALDVLARCRDLGLVQIADNVRSKPAWICNCCGCCCGQLRAITEFDLAAVSPSGFVAGPDAARCRGCSRCARACPIGAIAMVPRRVPASPKAALDPVVDPDRCIGCAVCVGACPSGGMVMSRRADRPTVPANALERVVLMAVERGRLAQLLCDEGAGRGAAFLNGVLRAMQALPGAQRVLASEQVKSRFVRALLRGVPDPT